MSSRYNLILIGMMENILLQMLIEVSETCTLFTGNWFYLTFWFSLCCPVISLNGLYLRQHPWARILYVNQAITFRCNIVWNGTLKIYLLLFVISVPYENKCYSLHSILYEYYDKSQINLICIVLVLILVIYFYAVFLFIVEEYMAVTTMLSYDLHSQTSGASYVLSSLSLHFSI
jgi:hypothetical protein